jgi:hypothetical protein
MSTTQAKFKVGERVVKQPSPASTPMWGVVSGVNWNESFKEFAYRIQLESHGGIAMAWERELRAEKASKLKAKSQELGVVS